MGAVDFSLPVDGDIPSFRPVESRTGDFVDAIVNDLTREKSPFFDEVVLRWDELFPGFFARPGKWVPGRTAAAGGKLFLHVRSAPALFAARPKLAAIKKQLSLLKTAPVKFSVHLEIASQK
ncbi:MAG: hypothetical protein J6R18_10430 [Kiritimatiellae bacterium]|nr:hypothetical protein [Kiritimatiellia bacterium]